MLDLKKINRIFDNPPKDDLKGRIMQKREKDQFYPRRRMFVEGKTMVVDELGKIRDALVSKDGIVGPDEQDVFRKQIERSFSDDLISAMREKQIDYFSTTSSVSGKQSAVSKKGSSEFQSDEGKQKDFNFSLASTPSFAKSNVTIRNSDMVHTNLSILKNNPKMVKISSADSQGQGKNNS